MSKTVLILGGGIGGIVAASLLRKRLPRAHRVVLVEREERYLFPPSPTPLADDRPVRAGEDIDTA